MSGSGEGSVERRESLSILHLTTFYPPDNFGGDGIHVERLAHAQSARGHRVTVVHAPAAHRLLAGDGGAPVGTGSTARTERAGSGVEVRRIPGGGGLEPFLMHQLGRPVLARRRLRDWLEPKRGGPDVIHFHNISLAGGPWVLRLGDAVKLMTCHEYWLRCSTHMLFRYGREPCEKRTCVRCTLRARRPPQWWRYGSLTERSLGHLDRLLFPSATARDAYRAHGLDRTGVLLPHFLPARELRAAAGRGRRSPDTEPYFLYVGRLDGVKGVDHLLAAWADRDGGPELRIAGDGPLAEPLRRRYAGHPLVRFLGVRSGDELGELYRDAIALILPSAGYETFGQVVAEAFVHATPSLVTETGGGRELVEAAGAGVVYRTDAELHETIDRLAGNTALRDELGRRGRSFVAESLSEERYLERYERLVAECRT